MNETIDGNATLLPVPKSQDQARPGLFISVVLLIDFWLCGCLADQVHPFSLRCQPLRFGSQDVDDPVPATDGICLSTLMMVAPALYRGYYENSTVGDGHDHLNNVGETDEAIESGLLMDNVENV